MREEFTAEWLPSALAMGVSESQFWNMNPRRLTPYVQADGIRLERANMTAWLCGAYVRDAVASCFCRGVEYPEKPIRITPMSEAEKEEAAEAERQKALDFFRRLEASFKRKEEMKRDRGAD
ncbi:MAG: hypothetical protein IJF49_08500 [Clostridia bacterium]|nr:hypothetical protein [Clostridia bacterium]